MSGNILERRWPWLLVATILLAILVSSFVEIRVRDDLDDRPIGTAADISALRDRKDLNVLFILIDTLRAERLSSYGYHRPTSPKLDRLAASGVRFARHLAQSSWTKTSMASLWTGMLPMRTGITRFDHVLPEDALTTAEIFRDAGFRTVGVWRNGWVSPTFGFEQGFDVYTRPLPKPLPPTVRLENPTLKMKGTDEDVVGAAIEFMRLDRSDRWFLYLHLMDVHEYLYDEETALFGTTYSDAYDNSIRWTDSVIEVLMEHLAYRGMADRTLIVIGSDHGEAFRERGLEGHARHVYRESTEVPLLVIFPFKLETGGVVNVRTRNMDVWPTVLDLVGLTPPPEADGRSLVPDMLAALRGESPTDGAPPAISHLDQTWGRSEEQPKPAVAVSDGWLRYVRSLDGPRVVEELFDAEQDAREAVNRARTEPETLARMRGMAEAYLDLSPPWGETPTREIDELELNHLRALGYAIP